MRYKLRAEVIEDVYDILRSRKLLISNFILERKDYLPDCVIEFESLCSLDEIISYLKQLDDAHVMYQTVKPVAEYTGERNYSI